VKEQDRLETNNDDGLMQVQITEIYMKRAQWPAAFFIYFMHASLTDMINLRAILMPIELSMSRCRCCPTMKSNDIAVSTRIAS